MLRLVNKDDIAKPDADRLRELEDIVDRGLATFVEVGRALQEIRDAQLYRAAHTSFAEYVKERFGISRPHAYRLIDAAEIKVALSPIGDIRNEAVARELAPLWRKDPAEAEQVWRDAGADISARDLKSLVTRRLGQIERAEERENRIENTSPEKAEPEAVETVTEHTEFIASNGHKVWVSLWDESSVEVSVMVPKRNHPWAGDHSTTILIPLDIAVEIANEIGRIVEFNPAAERPKREAEQVQQVAWTVTVENGRVVCTPTVTDEAEAALKAAFENDPTKSKSRYYKFRRKMLGQDAPAYNAALEAAGYRWGKSHWCGGNRVLYTAEEWERWDKANPEVSCPTGEADS